MLSVHTRPISPFPIHHPESTANRVATKNGHSLTGRYVTNQRQWLWNRRNGVYWPDCNRNNKAGAGLFLCHVTAGSQPSDTYGHVQSSLTGIMILPPGREPTKSPCYDSLRSNTLRYSALCHFFHVLPLTACLFCLLIFYILLQQNIVHEYSILV
jgi:hypothetical protein